MSVIDKIDFNFVNELSVFMPMKNLNFKEHQLTFERFKKVEEQKWEKLQNDLKKRGFSSTFSILIIAYKNESLLEIWLKNEKHFLKFKTYKIVEKSGNLGPKVKEGDLQIPEGIYNIVAFNPQSKYHLSLGINYPNEIDLRRTGIDNLPGGEIYLHGGKETKGCITIGDEKIEELYLLAVEAKVNGQTKLPIYLFPFKMTDENLVKYGNQFPEHLTFWKSLQLYYSHFESYRSLANFKQVI